MGCRGLAADIPSQESNLYYKEGKLSREVSILRVLIYLVLVA